MQGLSEIPAFLVNEMSELTFEDLNLHGSTGAKGLDLSEN